ncbi:hypothetical protein PQG02_06895 [Nostoc sp. UHCC 0926]|uniref:hypothetical protein n=1 Tax=unclassified Nostoc TaxID=2593658 RepID=UPI00235E1432|nr:hypothetical protein [Nostoc sp. UHCC 0926]WDD34068.1 hypothetical protein PQG02_06895 [Nostoc sp. UHCC 0926]
MLRAKFTCQENILNHENQTVTVILTPTTASAEENLPFWKATPASKITLEITNSEASAQFSLGTNYYVDFTAVA